MPKDTERKMIDEVADIIRRTLADGGLKIVPSPELCRRAAVLVINRLADSYDEMQDAEPAKE